MPCRRRVRPPRTPARSPRRPWTRPTERAAGRPCYDATVCARRRLRRRRRGDGRARSVDPRARGAAMGYFFPRRVRRKRRQRDDRDAIDAERRAPRRTRRALSARRRSVIHRRRAAAARTPRGPLFFFLGFFSRDPLRGLSLIRSGPLRPRGAGRRRSASERALTSAIPPRAISRRSALSLNPLSSSRPTKSSWSCRAATPARRL